MRKAKGGKRKTKAGKLVVIGGAEDRSRERTVLREFVRLAGGADAVVTVIAVASEVPKEVVPLYVETFGELGVRDVCSLRLGTRADANKPGAVRMIEKSTGVFFTGGNQLRITRLLGGTELDAALHRRYEAGLVLAGTSAGAAMMSGIMIVGSAPEAGLRVGQVELGPGMDFLPGVLIDQHFEQRGRLRRLLAAIVQYPHELGLGIDEDTAVVVSGDVFKVLGAGAVTVIDAGGMTHTNLNSAGKDDLLAVCDVKIHVLPSGYGFDLRRRVPLNEPEPAGAADTKI